MTNEQKFEASIEKLNKTSTTLYKKFWTIDLDSDLNQVRVDRILYAQNGHINRAALREYWDITIENDQIREDLNALLRNV